MVADDEADDIADRKRLGAALAFLRERADLTQDAAAEAAGYATGQGFARYEQGKSPAIFRPSVQRRLLTAIGSTVEELHMIAAARDAIAVRAPGELTDTAAFGAARRGSEVVPVRGRLQAGAWTPVDDLADQAAKASPLVVSARR